MRIQPESVASQKSLFALGLGLLAFMTSASPVGILGLAIPAGLAAIVLGLKEARGSAKRSKTRRLAGAGVAFTILGYALAAAWIYVALSFASAFGGSPSIDLGRLMCTACHVLSQSGAQPVDEVPRPRPAET